MLAKWREMEKEKFQKVIKNKENLLLEKLQAYWLQRETEIQTVLARRDKEISTLASRVEQALKRMAEKGFPWKRVCTHCAAIYKKFTRPNWPKCRAYVKDYETTM